MPSKSKQVAVERLKAVTEPQAFIQLTDLSKTFQEGEVSRTVLNHISTKFNQGEFIAILGQSGSGKSTLLNLLAGIERPTTGIITINGVTLTNLNERACTLFRRDHIGFIFQFFNLIPTLTVLENITLPQELAGGDRRQLAQIGQDLLTQVDLDDRGQDYPDKLSGGQQQRVAIARAIAHDPMVVLADEPTGNLDEQTGETILQLLLDVTRNANKTLIMATHNPAIAQQADRVLTVHNGQLEGPNQAIAG